MVILMLYYKSSLFILKAFIFFRIYIIETDENRHNFCLLNHFINFRFGNIRNNVETEETRSGNP